MDGRRVQPARHSAQSGRQMCRTGSRARLPAGGQVGGVTQVRAPAPQTGVDSDGWRRSSSVNRHGAAP